jgi:hypothetical protein
MGWEAGGRRTLTSAVHPAAMALLPQYLDPSAYLPVLGAIDQATAVLKLKFDHIFYTWAIRAAVWGACSAGCACPSHKRV